MARKIVVAIDKFKGSATSQQLAGAIADAIAQVDPQCEVAVVPVADGGDGTMLAITQILKNNATTLSLEVQAPLVDLPPVQAQYLFHRERATAFMDMATASGLALVPSDKRDAMMATSLGTGMMISHALNMGAKEIVLGLGGSATTDAATGILAALGLEFLDEKQHHVFPCGKNLDKIALVDHSGKNPLLAHTHFTLLTDVTNPLYGENGAACVYAPQKGATPQQVEALDRGLRNMARFMPADVPSMAGAGAAGGVAAGMTAFLNATIKPGIEAILEMADFDNMVKGADLVITGEGRIDSQTAMGKAPTGVLRHASSQGVPVVALCGSMASDIDSAKLNFKEIIAVTPQGTPLHEAMNTARTLANTRNAVITLMQQL